MLSLLFLFTRMVPSIDAISDSGISRIMSMFPRRVNIPEPEFFLSVNEITIG